MVEQGEGSSGYTADSQATIGVKYRENSSPPEVGPGGVIRAGTIIYDDVSIQSNFATGHYALIREKTTIGDDVLVGTHTTIDGTTTVGDSVSMQTGVYVPSSTKIGSRVFIGPNATLLNDPYPVRQEVELNGPNLRDGVSIGANATILPGVTIGEGSFVAAGTVVTKDIPPQSLVVGVPGKVRTLPEELRAGNKL